MTEIQHFLRTGQSILAAKEEAAQKAAQEQRDKMLAIFVKARGEAIAMFGSISSEVQIEPESPGEGWDVDYVGTLTFSVRPFGDEAGEISVRLVARPEYCGDDRIWKWAQKDDRFAYYVDSRWTISSDGSVWSDHYETTGSLGEAIALCHKFGPDYRAAVERGKAAKARDEQRASERQHERSKTPAEKLTDALTEFCQALIPDPA